MIFIKTFFGWISITFFFFEFATLFLWAIWIRFLKYWRKDRVHQGFSLNTYILNRFLSLNSWGLFFFSNLKNSFQLSKLFWQRFIVLSQTNKSFSLGRITPNIFPHNFSRPKLQNGELFLQLNFIFFNNTKPNGLFDFEPPRFYNPNMISGRGL